jgi:hypothetical protein
MRVGLGARLAIEAKLEREQAGAGGDNADGGSPGGGFAHVAVTGFGAALASGHEDEKQRGKGENPGARLVIGVKMWRRIKM